jgi:hypothetical protein
MENINKKKYWLRGGILFASMSMVVGFWFMQGVDSDTFLILTHGLVALPFVIIFRDIFSADGEMFRNYESFFIVLSGTVTYFILGVIAGWIYGKIKNRKKPPLNI